MKILSNVLMLALFQVKCEIILKQEYKKVVPESNKLQISFSRDPNSPIHITTPYKIQNLHSDGTDVVVRHQDGFQSLNDINMKDIAESNSQEQWVGDHAMAHDEEVV